MAAEVQDLKFRNEQLGDENANLADTMNDQKRQVLSLQDEAAELTSEVGSLKKNLEDKTKSLKRILEKKENEILELKERNFSTEGQLESLQHTQTLTNFKGTETHNSLLKKIETLNITIDQKNAELTETKTTNKILKKGLRQYQEEKQLSTSKVPLPPKTPLAIPLHQLHRSGALQHFPRAHELRKQDCRPRRGD